MVSGIKLELVSFGSDQILYQYHMFGIFLGIGVWKCYEDCVKLVSYFQRADDGWDVKV